MSTILTSEHYCGFSYSFAIFKLNVTHVMSHIPCLRIRRFEVHDSHLADFGLKWDRHIHTQLSRRLDGYILQNGVEEVLSLSWRSVSGIEGSHKISGMAAK